MRFVGFIEEILRYWVLGSFKYFDG